MNGENATVENSNFTGNNATNGAGIVSNGNNTNINGTTFTNNTAETGSGAVLNGANATVENSNFTGNNASSGTEISLGDNATDTKLENISGVPIENITSRTATIILEVPTLVKVGDDATINVTVNNALGNVTLFINGVINETKELDGTKKQFVLSGLTKGTYVIKVEYSGGNMINSNLGSDLLGASASNDVYIKGFESKTMTVDYRTFAELQDIIDQSTGIVVLDHDYAFGDEDTGAIIINKSITINGNGHTIDGNDKSSIFNITAENVVIANVTLINGKSVDNGGAITWSGDNGTIENTTFANNTAENGGAVYVSGNNMTIENSTFTGNNATSYW